MVFREDTSCVHASHPKALEVLMQLKIAVKTMEEDLHRNMGKMPSSNGNVTKTINKERPRVFIGCSKEGLNIAKLVQLHLKDNVNSIIWHQGVFGLSHGTLETLTENCRKFYYAIFILTPDDIVIKGNNKKLAARDNVMFELGLFTGAIGRDKTFIVCNRNVELPTDLAGVVVAYFSDDADDLVASLGPTCTKLELQMNVL